MTKSAADGRDPAVTSRLKEHLDAHAKAIDDLHEKIKAIPGAVDDRNRAQVAGLIERSKTVHKWLSDDAFGCIPPVDHGGP